MTDVRADETPEEDRLPWLEAVEEEGPDDGPSAVKLVAAVVIGLLCIGLVVGGLFWLGNRNGEGGTELIEAPEGAYKVQPDDPGGMAVEGEGDTSFAASEGAEPQGNLAMRTPEAPVTQQPPAQTPQAAPQQQQQQQPQAQPQQQQASGPSATVQLGAFSTQAAANRAWTALSGRFGYLAPLSHSVTPVEAGDRTLYRLRASGAGAADVCRRLQVAGESCTVVN